MNVAVCKKYIRSFISFAILYIINTHMHPSTEKNMQITIQK